MSMIHIAGNLTLSKLTNVQENDVQPNAVDLRLGKVLRISNTAFVIDEQAKTHRLTTVCEPDQHGYWNLDPGSYEIVMENEITVGKDEAGWVITRSTLNRNGVFITSGLYDSMYHGSMAAVLHVTTGNMIIRKGTRIGQFVLFKSEMLKQYEGSYGFDKDGKPKPDEQKYHD